MGETVVVDIVEAVAQVEGVDAADLDYALHDYIDTEALGMLAAHDGAPWSLTFELPDHEVTVTSDGLILVDDAWESTWT
jgi:hypothetical protein